MWNFGVCPRCQLELSEESKQSLPPVCSGCGFVVSKTEKELQSGLQRRFIKAALAIGVLVVLGFGQLATWGDHAVEALFIQARSLIGANSAMDHERTAQICLE